MSDQNSREHGDKDIVDVLTSSSNKKNPVIFIAIPAILILLIIAFFSGESDTSNTALNDGYVRHEHKEFTIEYPKTWKSIKPSTIELNMPTDTIKVMFFDENEDSFDNLNIEVQEADFIAPSAEYLANLTVNQMQLFGESMFGMSNFTKIDFNEKKYGQFKAGVLTSKYEISQTGHELVLSQYIVPIKNKVYVLSITTNLDNYEEDKDMINRIIDSFTIKN